MTVKDIIDMLQPASRIRILCDGEPVYTGFRGTLKYASAHAKACLQMQVQGFWADTEIRHREWRRLGLMAPLMPEQLPEYNFKDLQMSVYYVFRVEGECAAAGAGKNTAASPT